MLYLDYAKPVEGGYILNFFADDIKDIEEISNGKKFVTKNGTDYGVPLDGSTVVITSPDKTKKTYILGMGGTWAEGDRFSQYINYKLTTFPTELLNVYALNGISFAKQTEMRVPLILGENVYDIDPRTFYYSGITSVTFLAPFMSIYQEAFYGCKNLTSVVFPSHGVSVSGEDVIFGQAFYGCENLTSVVFPENWYEGGRLTFHEQAFYGCKNLTSLTIPKAAIEIDFGSQALYIGSEENKATITFNGGPLEFLSEDVINPKTTDKIITFDEATAEIIKTQLPSVANLVEVVSK